MTIRLHIQLPARAGLFRISDCEAEAVVTWPAEVFRAFLEYPKRQDSLSAIACYREEEGRGRVYCGVLILGEGREGGVFAYDCGQHFAYLPGAKAVVDSILEQAAEKIIRAVAANSTGGRWRLSFNALRDQMGLVVSQHNGTGAMLLERLRMRPEAAAAGMDSGGFTLRLCQEPCQKALRRKKDSPKPFSARWSNRAGGRIFSVKRPARFRLCWSGPPHALPAAGSASPTRWNSPSASAAARPAASILTRRTP